MRSHKTQSSCAQEEHCPSHLTGRAGRHSSLLLKCPSRAVRARKRVQEHKPTTSSTCEAMPRALDSEATQEVPGLWRKRDMLETVPFRLRIGHRLHQRGIFSYTPEPHIAFCPIIVHPLFPVFEPHIQKWVIFIRHRPCVCDTFIFESPPLRGKKIEFGTDSLLLPRADCDN